MYRCIDTGNLYLIETLASGEVSMRMMVVSESIELMSPTKPCFQGPTKPCFQVNMVNLVEEYMKNANTEDIKIFNDMYHPDRNGWFLKEPQYNLNMIKNNNYINPIDNASNFNVSVETSIQPNFYVAGNDPNCSNDLKNFDVTSYTSYDNASIVI